MVTENIVKMFAYVTVGKYQAELHTDCTYVNMRASRCLWYKSEDILLSTFIENLIFESLCSNSISQK